MNGNYRAVGPNGFGTYTFSEGKLGERTDVPAEGLAIPGLVDLHIHGAFGVDFMTAPTEDLVRWLDQLEAIGYEALLPTTVTASATDVLAAFARCPQHRLVQGFHLEGPFISPAYPGAQPPSAIVNPPTGPSEWDEVLDHPMLRLVTMAPERPGGLGLVERLAARGVLVSLGHTDATYAEALEALASGARHTTHTYNAMRPLHHREAGMVGFALREPGIRAELIYDRVHVCREAADILIRAKGLAGVLAVSDSTMASGLPPGTRLKMWNLDCEVKTNSVRLAESGALAGSTITLMDAFRNLAADFGEELAIHACCLNPRAALGLGAPQRTLFLDEALTIRESIWN